MSMFASRSVYTIRLRLDDPPANLVPDMKVQVEIDLADLENVLSVPTTAVIKRNRRDQVAVKKPGGGFEWRDVTLGLQNATSVEVKGGIEIGDQVILEPAKLISADGTSRR